MQVLRNIATLIAAILVGTALTAQRAHAAAPLTEHLFEETGTTALNTGTLGSAANLTMETTAASPTDRHSPAGDGVSVISLRALDHRFGDTSIGAHAISSGNVAGLNSLSGMTVTGWYLSERADRLVGNERKLVANTGGSAGFRIEGGESGPNQDMLRLAANGGAIVSGTGTYPNPGSAKYTFFAVTFDGTSGSNNVQFYRGYTDTPAAVVATVTLAVSNTGLSTEVLSLGGHTGLNAPRTFHGLLDDVRIYGSVLSGAEIAQVQASSLPEPTCLGLLLVGGMMVMRRRRVRTA
jgi:hypothetical protein